MDKDKDNKDGDKLQKLAQALPDLSNPINVPHISTEYFNNTKALTELVLAPETLEQLSRRGFYVKLQDNGTSYLAIDFSALPGVQLDISVTAFDVAIMDAVYTLYANGIPYFTAQAIARVISGNLDGHKRITRQRIEAIEESVEKMRKVDVRIDMTHEFKPKKGKRKRKIYLRSVMMPVNVVDIEQDGGRTEHAYYPNGDGLSAFYEYAQMRRQMIDVPAERLRLPDGVQDTTEAVVIKQYLIKRIERLLNPRNGVMNKHISYCRYDRKSQRIKGMYVEIGLDPGRLSRDHKYTIHDTVRKILDSFVADGYIKGYTETRNGKTITGVTLDIDLPEGKGKHRKDSRTSADKGRTSADDGRTSDDTQSAQTTV